MKQQKILCLISAVLFCLLSLAACTASASITGVWKITECIVDGKALVDMNDCYFYFYEDGTGKKVILDEEQFRFSYSYDGNTCVLFNITYDDGETEAGTYAEMRVHGDTMQVSAVEDGIEELITLKRLKE